MNRHARLTIVCLLLSMATTSFAQQAPPQLRLALDLMDGSHVIGVPSISAVPMKTSFAEFDMELKQIQGIAFNEDKEAVSVELRNGDKVSGVLRVDDRIEVPYDVSLFQGRAFTLCAWIYRRDADTARNIISATYNNPPDRYLYLLNASPDGKLGLHSYEGAPLFRAESEPVLAAHRWHFVCGTFDSGLDSKNAKVYVDGRLRGTADHRTPLRGYDGPLNIGCYQNRAGGARYRGHFKGILDEVMIWDRALSAAEVRQLYEAGK